MGTGTPTPPCFGLLGRQEVENATLVETGEGLQLDHIHPTLTGFAPGHPGLRLVHGLGDVVLGQAGLLSGGLEAPEEGPVLR